MLKAHELKELKRHINDEDPRLPIVFSALSDNNRCNIFRCFLTEKRLCVSDIANTLGISMSLASQHLKTLEVTGMLNRQKEGRVVYFSPNDGDKLVASIIRSVTQNESENISNTALDNTHNAKRTSRFGWKRNKNKYQV